MECHVIPTVTHSIIFQRGGEKPPTSDMSIGEKQHAQFISVPWSPVRTFRQEYEKQENARRMCPTGLREDEVDASGESWIDLDHLDPALAAC